MSHWIAMHCTPEREELQAIHPNAWLLLCQIACRAKYRDCPVTGLKKGQAYIGDYRRAGLASRGAYRGAQNVLARLAIATFRTTSKGTIATLGDSTLFSISAPAGDQPATIKQPSGSHPATTNTQGHSTQDTETQKRRRRSLSAALNPCGEKAGTPGPGEPFPAELAALWELAPRQSQALSSTAKVAAEWAAIPAAERPAGDTLLAAMTAWKASRPWTSEDGRYIMSLHRWVAERKWTTLPDPAPSGAAATTQGVDSGGAGFERLFPGQKYALTA